MMCLIEAVAVVHEKMKLAIGQRNNVHVSNYKTLLLYGGWQWRTGGSKRPGTFRHCSKIHKYY